jgi:hypothetical protein
MRALSIRQPFAELNLRGAKTIEYRSRPTRIIGQRFWIYASKSRDQSRGMTDQASAARTIWSNDLAVTTPRHGEHPPGWMIELAEALILDKLPTGVIVGSAVIDRCVPIRPKPGFGSELTGFEWHLTGVQRAGELVKPTGRPQPAWFTPF